MEVYRKEEIGEGWMRHECADDRATGAQPVSFCRSHIETLKQEECVPFLPCRRCSPPQARALGSSEIIPEDIVVLTKLYRGDVLQLLPLRKV